MTRRTRAEIEDLFQNFDRPDEFDFADSFDSALFLENETTDDLDEGSTNLFFTSAEQTKLGGIEVGAEVNTVDSVNAQTGVVVLDTGDIASIVDSRYVSDSDLTTLSNTSGTNTDDETTASIQSKRQLKTIEGQSLEGIGNIDLDATDVGLGNVDNTSDLLKPISTATQNALNFKSELNGASSELFEVSNGISTFDSVNKGQLDSAISDLQGALIPQGNWNADTNTPDITGTTKTGYYWIVSVDGSTDLGGITDWKVNDWAIKTDTGWAKIDNTDTVMSVAGKTGVVTLNISDIVSLQSSLDAKVDENAAIVASTHTKITYDAKGLIVSGVDATTADIADSMDARYVTDADLVVIGNTSGTNTNDQTTIVGIAGTKAEFDTSLTDGNFLFDGDVTQYTDEQAQDAVGAMVDGSLIYDDVTPALSRAALTGAITATEGSNATSLGSFTTAQINTALSDNNIATGGGTATGPNTGDQTSVTGNAGTSTELETARDINGVAFDGTADITVAAASGTLTGTTLNPTVVNSSLTNFGNIPALNINNAGNTSSIDMSGGGLNTLWTQIVMNRAALTRGAGYFVREAITPGEWFVGVPYRGGSNEQRFVISYDDTDAERIDGANASNAKMTVDLNGDVSFLGEASASNLSGTNTGDKTAENITGTTLNATVVNSSLENLGVLTELYVGNEYKYNTNFINDASQRFSFNITKPTNFLNFSIRVETVTRGGSSTTIGHNIWIGSVKASTADAQATVLQEIINNEDPLFTGVTSVEWDGVSSTEGNLNVYFDPVSDFSGTNNCNITVTFIANKSITVNSVIQSANSLAENSLANDSINKIAGMVGVGIAPTDILHLKLGGLKLTNSEIANTSDSVGTILFDENYYQSGEAGFPYFNGNGGGLAVKNEDGWGALISTTNMQFLDMEINSLLVDGDSISGTNTGDVKVFSATGSGGNIGNAALLPSVMDCSNVDISNSNISSAGSAHTVLTGGTYDIDFSVTPVSDGIAGGTRGYAEAAVTLNAFNVVDKTRRSGYLREQATGVIQGSIQMSATLILSANDTLRVACSQTEAGNPGVPDVSLHRCTLSITKINSSNT